MMFIRTVRNAVFLLCASSTIGLFAPSMSHADLGTWLSTQSGVSQSLMLANISMPGTAAGSVVAAPAVGASPDYYYHWVRDSGLTMQVVVELYNNASGTDKAAYQQYLTDFVTFSSKIQQTPNLSGNPWDTGPGEPKFNVDGSDFTGNWGRPQNDGPAIRASAMMRFANLLIDQGQMAYVDQYLYQATLPATTLIKADLEFVSHHWSDPSYDLWEEVEGTHFYTRMVQRRALVEGAEFAARMGDAGAAAFYSSQAQQIEQQLSNHWNAQLNYLVETLNEVQGITYKSSGLDVAVVLGALHGTISLNDPSSATSDDALFNVVDDRILLTALKLKQTFQSLFSINQTGGPGVGPGIGRYPEDTYNGYATGEQGNPWFLATFGFGELYYRAANLYEANGQIPVTQAFLSWFQDMTGSSAVTLTVGETVASSDSRFASVLSIIRAQGDEFLARGELHADPAGNLSEEFNRDTGFMQGAANLTWSHASFITASWARANSN